MQKLVDDPDFRNALAMGAGQYAKDKLSWSRIAELTEETYCRAIASRCNATERFVVDESA
ncbi:MAG: hypothetical protein ABI640_13720 [Gammaproteobacteria bacterium]